MSYTENFSDFGARERGLLIDILTAWDQKGLPTGFWSEDVRPAFNTSSGNVFLVNADYQVAMLQDNHLQIWHTLPYSGQEGFESDLLELDFDSLNLCDQEYIANLEIGQTT
jgi:hypothetical protein